MDSQTNYKVRKIYDNKLLVVRNRHLYMDVDISRRHFGILFWLIIEIDLLDSEGRSHFLFYQTAVFITKNVVYLQNQDMLG